MPTATASLLVTSARALTGNLNAGQMAAFTIGMPLGCVDHLMHAWLAIHDVEHGKGSRESHLFYAANRLGCAEATAYALKGRAAKKGAEEIASLRVALSGLGVDVPVYQRPAAV